MERWDLEWYLILVVSVNEFKSDRYNNHIRSTLPEICNAAIDYRMEELEESFIDLADVPVYIMVVDATQLGMP